MTSNAPATVRLDVRPVLAAGEEPFELIMRTASDVPAGGTLELIAPFDPVPLYQVMSKSGFSARTTEGDDGSWVVCFTRVELGPESTVAEVHAQYPGTASVFAKHGMDLCCGGHLSLAHVARAHDVPLESLLEELKSAAVGT